jgi:hypothetical protein
VRFTELLALPVGQRVRLMDILVEGLVIARTDAGPVIRWAGGDDDPIGPESDDLSELAGALELLDDGGPDEPHVIKASQPT